MRFTLPMTVLLVLVTASVGGCGGNSPPEDENTGEQPTADQSTGEQPTSGHPHSHAGGDALVWVDKDVEHEGFLLALGHHGKHLHAASFVEPAVSITRDGVAVADAEVFNSLLAADAEELIREEVPTIYEPETEEEPAHYAQGKLHLPKGSKQFVIRFRIKLPDVEKELTRDITIDVEEE